MGLPDPNFERAPMTIRWLHISDVHECNRDGYNRTSMFEAIVTAVKEREPKPHFVFFTGDLAFSGGKPEYDLLRDRFLNPLREALPDECPIFTVPGNHDVNRKRVVNPRTWIESETERNAFQKVDQDGRQKRVDAILPRFEAYREIEQELAAWGEDWLASETGAVCVKREAAGHKLAIVGINTAWLCHDNEDWGRLTAGKTMIEAALKSAAGAELTIVLGHHPLAAMNGEKPWSDGERIRQRLLQANAIYLHGHLHKSGGQITSDSMQSVLAIQAPSGFQAPDDPTWRNGIMWGEADIAVGRLIIEPLRWNDDNSEFVFDIDAAPSKLRAPGGREAFAFPLPGRDIQEVPVDPTTPSAPDGWEIIDAARLADLTAEKPSAAEMADWFNGSFPIWEVATARDVRPRPLVDELARRYRAAFRGAARPFVRLLTGAGGEGKSAALMQLAASLLREEGQSWTCFWRQAAAADLPENLGTLLPRKDNHAWIIAIDDAEGIGKPLRDAIANLGPRTDVHVILAAREADWALRGNTDPQWQAVADFQRVVLAGIDEADARCIAETWAAWGEEAMGRLRGSSVEQAARALHGHAREFATRKEEGALLGALLMTREGEDYRQRVKRLMEPLRGAEGIGQYTLLSIYAMIAAMHAENQLYLSRAVLAYALNCDEAALDRGPLRTLRREAMVDGGTAYVLIRHRLIAEVARDWLVEEGYDVDRVYPQLAVAAVKRSKATLQGQDVSRWQFELWRHFVEGSGDKPSVAVSVARALWEFEPTNFIYLTNYAKVLRKTAGAPAALKLFAENAHRFPGRRDVLYEWSVAAGEKGDHGLNAWLAARSLADNRGHDLSAKQAKLGLAGLGRALEILGKKSGIQTFRRAQAACGRLGLLLPDLDDTTLGYFRRNSEAASTPAKQSVDEDIARLRDAALEASYEAEAENTGGLDAQIGEPDSYRYTMLAELLSGKSPRRPGR